MRTLAAGPGGVLYPGQVCDLPSTEAEAMVSAGHAELVIQAKVATPPETAEAPEAEETADAPQPQRRRR